MNVRASAFDTGGAVPHLAFGNQKHICGNCSKAWCGKRLGGDYCVFCAPSSVKCLLMQQARP